MKSNPIILVVTSILVFSLFSISRRANAIPRDLYYGALKHEAYFGMELTFNRGEEFLDISKIIQTWIELMEKECEEKKENLLYESCVVLKPLHNPFSGKNENPGILFKREKKGENFWFTLEHDQQELEINTRPLTLNQVMTFKYLIQEYIFDYALKKEVNLTPHRFTGGGHIHIDIETAFKNPVHMLNFITDLNQVLITPVRRFESNAEYAVPLSALDEKTQERYQNKLKYFSKKKKLDFEMVIKDLLSIYPKEWTVNTYERFRRKNTSINIAVDYKNDTPNKIKYSILYKDKNKPKLLKDDKDHDEDYMIVRTVELRTLPPQLNVDELILWLTLIQQSINKTNSEEINPYVIQAIPTISDEESNTENIDILELKGSVIKDMKIVEYKKQQDTTPKFDIKKMAINKEVIDLAWEQWKAYLDIRDLRKIYNKIVNLRKDVLKKRK